MNNVKMIDRPRMYAQCLARVNQELRANPNIKHRGGDSYKDGIGRRRVRAVARKMARAQMREIRAPKEGM